jgi:hypothetical protein
MLIFDNGESQFDEISYHRCDWSSHFPATEKIPDNTPNALGHSVVMTCYVDADHAGCRVTCFLHAGILMYVNHSAIV